MYSRNLFLLNPCSKDQRKEHNEVIIGFATSCPSHTILLQKNAISDGGSTVVYAAYTVDTIQTAQTLAYLPIYC